jgi:hypothetical protein
MSTSRKRHIPLRYMGKGSNVLLCLRPNLETDEAYHSGAAISIISQFAAEDEVLCVRPLGLPCTQLAHSLRTVHACHRLPLVPPLSVPCALSECLVVTQLGAASRPVRSSRSCRSRRPARGALRKLLRSTTRRTSSDDRPSSRSNR